MRRRSPSYIEQEDSNVIQFYKLGEPVPVRASAKELNDHFIQLRNRAVLAKPTRTVGKLTAQGVGREYLSTVLWSETGLYSVQYNGPTDSDTVTSYNGPTDSDIMRLTNGLRYDTIHHPRKITGRRL